jgi:hypothetical protein
MLLLLFKSFWWAAWWPYYTMLLALEKSMANQPARPKPHPADAPRHTGGSVRDGEQSMAADALMKTEVPPALRELMKMSIEQAKRAFETFVATSEKSWKSLESGSQSGYASLYALNAKIAEITRANAEANFALAMRLAEAKDVTQVIELHNDHITTQTETFVRQLEEMRDLATQVIQEANPGWIDAGVRSTRSSHLRSASSGAGSGHSPSYAPSSSFTPGKTGRTKFRTS